MFHKKEILGCPNYYATINGEIYHKNSVGYAKIESRKHSKGYLQVEVNGTKLVHRLVALAFHPIPQGFSPEDLHVHHKNGSKNDNRPDNLEWVTPMQHAQKHNFAQ